MSVKRAHILQHVAFEGPGYIAQWLAMQGAEITSTAWFDANPQLPPLPGIDLLVCLGGPMSVHDTAIYPWLSVERDYLRQAILSGVPTLGICLGAQQISLCLGGEVRANPVREIGWFPLIASATESNVPDVLRDLSVLHWHGECFSLPDSAQLLARSAVCNVQAALFSETALGLQCHLEIEPEGLAALVAHCADDLAPGPSVQRADTLLHWPQANYSEMHLALTKLLVWLTSKHSSGG